MIWDKTQSFIKFFFFAKNCPQTLNLFMLFCSLMYFNKTLCLVSGQDFEFFCVLHVVIIPEKDFKSDHMTFLKKDPEKFLCLI